MKTAIYIRVSTQDRRQNTKSQLLQLQNYCSQQGYTIHKIYEDKASGRNGREVRNGFNQLLQDASKRKFDLVLFWALDRFSREGIKKTVFYLELLESYGVKFKSYTEQYLDSSNELVGHILIGVLSYLAKQETIKLSERTKAGLERARKDGKQIGRSKIDYSQQLKIRKLAKAGKSNYAIGKQLGISPHTVKKYKIEE